MATFVLVGATGGIGSALARQLTTQGHRLVLAARGEERLQSLAEELDAVAIPTDVTDPEAVTALFEAATERFDGIDGAVGLTGSILLKPAHRTRDLEWAQTLDINLTAAFHVLRAATARMQKSGGSIVLMASAAAQLGLPNHEAIAAAKAGVIGLARSAAATYASRGIRVNVVSPGLVQTPLAERITRHEASREASRKLHPLGRLGEAEDVARAIAFLLDPANSWITGQIVGVDGGLATAKV